MYIVPVWVSENENIVENRIADELNRFGTELAICAKLQCIGFPIVVVNLDIIHSFTGILNLW